MYQLVIHCVNVSQRVAWSDGEVITRIIEDFNDSCVPVYIMYVATGIVVLI